MTSDYLVGDVDPRLDAAVRSLIPADYRHIEITYLNAEPLYPGRFRGTPYCRYRDDVSPPEVEVFIHRIPRLGRSRPALSHAGMMFEHVRVVLTGIGYPATEADCSDINIRDYASDSHVKAIVDGRALAWADTCMNQELVDNPTLGLPVRPVGFYARRDTRQILALSAYVERAEREPDRYPQLHRAKQRRYQLFAAFSHGGQLSPGDVLEQLGLDRRNPSHRARLRRVARREDIGITYRDSLGRECRLYHFGDVALIAAAWNRPRRTRQHPTTPPAVKTTSRP